jgi:hypothetical protein
MFAHMPVFGHAIRPRFSTAWNVQKENASDGAILTLPMPPHMQMFCRPKCSTFQNLARTIATIMMTPSPAFKCIANEGGGEKTSLKKNSGCSLKERTCLDGLRSAKPPRHGRYDKQQLNVQKHVFQRFSTATRMQCNFLAH